MTIYIDKNYNKEPKFIRMKELSSIIRNEYDDIYDELGLTGAPYIMTEIDGRYYIAEADQHNGIKTFTAENNQIINIEIVYDFGKANTSSVIAYYLKY